MNYKIFYSWQSDLPNKTNRGFIRDALEKAAKSFRNNEEVEESPRVDSDTKNEPGSPNIVESIFRKIDECHIFVCDVSIVNSGDSARLTPNPNVLIELGYAIKHLGFKKIILVFNTSYGELENLPFDLRHNRILTYYRSKDQDDKNIRPLELKNKFIESLKLIFEANKTFPKQEVQKANLRLDKWFLDQESKASKIISESLDLQGHFDIFCSVADSGVHQFSIDKLPQAVDQSVLSSNGFPPIGVQTEDSKRVPRNDSVTSDTFIRGSISNPSIFYEYWAFKKNGDFCLFKSYDSDVKYPDIKSLLYFDRRIQRVAEGVRFCGKLYSKLGISPETQITISIKHKGLLNRSLAIFGDNWRRHFMYLPFENLKSYEEETLPITFYLSQNDIENDLVGITERFCEPLFMLFNFKRFEIGVYQKIIEEI